MSQLPKNLAAHPNVFFADENERVAHIRGCKNCQTALKDCRCGNPQVNTAVLFNEHGLNQSLLDLIGANAKATKPETNQVETASEISAAPGTAVPPAEPFFQSIALPLAKRGLKVMPINGKQAFLSNHPQEATTDLNKIAKT